MLISIGGKVAISLENYWKDLQGALYGVPRLLTEPFS